MLQLETLVHLSDIFICSHEISCLSSLSMPNIDSLSSSSSLLKKIHTLHSGVMFAYKSPYKFQAWHNIKPVSFQFYAISSVTIC